MTAAIIHFRIAGKLLFAFARSLLPVDGADI